jgi:TolB-like protein/Tfp pilus assembly protein PilF/predicted Ser/Thr protein kinase
MAGATDFKHSRPEEEPSERRRQIEEIVIVALELAGDQRSDFLDSACGDDDALLREVESLLSQENRANKFLDTPAIEVAARALAAGDSAVLAGRTVGPYRIDALLGAGGMGEVYRAWDTRLRRDVALKFLAREFSTDSAAVEQFAQEARAASALSHPNICVVYDVGEMEERPFIAMEYLEGGTLRASMNGAVVAQRKALEYTLQIAHGLAAAHQKGIVHRDLKPENLWVTAEERIKILDFGVAKLIEPAKAHEGESTSLASEHGRVVGTAGYMSPEQVRGLRLDQRTDIFSVGTILHEMLSGERTFRGPSSLDTLIAILNTQPADLADPAMNRLVRRCLEKDPSRRFQSAVELAAGIETALTAPPVLARRRLLQAAGGAASLAGLLALAVWMPAKWRNRLQGSGGPRFTRIAVLPLMNLSGPDQDAFVDGMTDLLITDLGQIAVLRIIARPSVMRFKGAKQPLRDIAKQLGVEAVIVGSVETSGNRVRITAQLVDPATDQQIWARAYERELTDVFSLQSDVARAIAGEIQVRVTTEEAQRLSRYRKIVPAAFDAYLLGRFYWDQFQDESISKAIDYFHQAIQLDPDYAAAYSELATCWCSFLVSDARPWPETIAKAREAAIKALSLDDTIGEAHHAMGFVLYLEWDWKGAEAEVRNAIALNPGFSTSRVLICNVLRHQGRAAESISEAQKALEVDPLAIQTNQMLGNAYLSARQYDLAVAQFERGLDLHPNESSLQYQLGWAYFYSGSVDKGIESIRDSIAVDIGDPDLSPDLAYIYATTGKIGRAREILNRLLELAKKSPVSPGMIALVYVALDQRELALSWLEKAYKQHSSIMTWLKTDPRFDRIRADPKFQGLMRSVGLI